ncbi:MAG: bifunctional [glutamate--ammonia ligase]-adenylyl-L-tyrosine phosphorylase/[glutamate--ammonia-ligase] adenylyltransferase [Desulfobacteraceae bacterium]|nr:bifunctional [glutamate--ammonia ligase]-adenylyl-L-tyrosine phosphorylase/[glutamate--ammonia-ligase] adenylyltransferase [Desulfobacteraceae bacterium]
MPEHKPYQTYKDTIENTFPVLGDGQKKIILTKINKIIDSDLISKTNWPDSSEFKKELIRSIFFSQFIESNLARFPEILKNLINANDLNRQYAKGEMFDKIRISTKNMLSESEFQRAICKAKLQEMIRISWRDLNRKALLVEVLNDLSFLADACIETVSSYIYNELSLTYGFPTDSNGKRQKLIILGMGKLGAGELNFSSDIDLIFVYPKNGHTDNTKPISNEDFFTKMCRKFIKFLSSNEDGINFYRVDTRLRPFGATGPLVMTCQEFEEYYQAQGREWERYAFIKTRPVAGDIGSGYKLLHDLNSFIYRRYFDYGTFDSFKDMKKRISLQIKNTNMQGNIKSGPGGIREIEFFGQIFQLIRGGVEPELQERKILTVLDSLVKYSCIDQKTKDDLSGAYIFLRMVENRIQEYADLQTHDLPKDEEARLKLSLSMNFSSFQDFSKVLNKHRTLVHQHFKELLVSEDDETDDKGIEGFKYLWLNINDAQSLIKTEKISGYDNIDQVVKQLQLLEEHPKTKRLATSGRTRLNRLIPLVLQKASKSNNPNTVLMRLIELIITIESRACYISLLLENRGALHTLSVLAEKSPWIISFLSQHPALLDELLDTKTLYSPPEKKELEQLLERRMSKIPDNDIEFLLEELSIFKQTNTLRVAAADISKNYPLMKVSDRLTYIAETVLDKVLEISWNIVVAKYGRPKGITLDELKTCGFAMVTYGKVGGLETGYKSDLDLIFICSEKAGTTQHGKKSIENIAFYSILSQRIISVLTMHTAAGQLYGADMRLRPGGQAGPIVTQINTLKEYFKTTAWTWEHQALIRARPVSGDRKIQSQFNKIREKIISKQRDSKILKADVLDMRERMKKEHLTIKKGSFDVKQGKGGIIDIEFLVQYLVLKNSYSHPDLTLWTDNIRLLESLAKEKIILQQECEELKEAYVVMRKAIHRLNLQEKEIMLPISHFKKLKTNVIAINNKYL